MCGRYTLTGKPGSIAKQFGVEGDPSLAQLEPSYNIAPSQPIPVVMQLPGQGRVLMFVRWGLVPSWAKDIDTRFSMINARAETLNDRPAYRDPFRHKRCLVPADGFYEWQATTHGKVPYYIRMHHGTPFAFAGLWDQRGDLFSCTIITTTPNRLMKPIHDRMPVILGEEHYANWLDPAFHDTGRLQSLLVPCGDEDMEAWPVSKAVNDPANNDPTLIEKTTLF